MIFKHFIAQYPYRLCWWLLRLVRKPEHTVFFCAQWQDWEIFEPVQKYLKPVTVVCNKKELKQRLKSIGIEPVSFPVFPKAVIMARHSCDRFPVTCIIKIGMRHGPYHFKKMIKATTYNQFDLYMFTSQDDLDEAIRLGVSCGKAIGYPKLDTALKNSYSETYLQALRQLAGINPGKPTLFFSATWTRSGMSAVELWIDSLHTLKDRYNVLVSLHPFNAKDYLARLESQGVYFVQDKALDHIYLSDIVVGDSSSLLAEACALDKPIVSWKTSGGKRSLPKIESMIESFALRVNTFSEMLEAFERYQMEPELKQEERAKANRIFFDELDGMAGKRAAAAITKILPELKL